MMRRSYDIGAGGSPMGARRLPHGRCSRATNAEDAGGVENPAPTPAKTRPIYFPSYSRSLGLYVVLLSDCAIFYSTVKSSHRRLTRRDALVAICPRKHGARSHALSGHLYGIPPM
jgi:hypothetical protein